VLEVASTNKSAESAKRLHENLKNSWPEAYQKREPPGKLYQTPAPHAQSITFGCAARKTLCLPYALVEVEGCAWEEQEGIRNRATGLPETKNGCAASDFGSVGTGSEQPPSHVYSSIPTRSRPGASFLQPLRLYEQNRER
jgi:hypothetical protein